MAKNAILAALMEVLPENIAKDVIEHRRAIKYPLTVTAARGLAREYGKTGNPEKAAEYHLIMGWRGFFAEWMNKPQIFRDGVNPSPKSGGAPQTFLEGTPDHIKARIVLPANHFTNVWKGKQ